jgi:serine/threonine protein kinase
MIVCTACGTDNADAAQTCTACGNTIATPAAATLSLPVGADLGQGAYRVGKKLGQGGFAITYLGSETKIPRAVAVKEFFPSNGGCARQNRTVCPGQFGRQAWDDAKKKFLAEAQALGKLSHPGIVRVYDSFEENDTAYIVMEFLRGETLDAIVEGRGAIPERDALDWIEQAGQALHAVHQANMLHRDLKPANMMLADGRGVVLIDFGAAREFTAGLSKSMSQVLTAGYAPLEQYGARAKFGPFTDIYGLAATLYHLVTNFVPTSSTDRVNGVDLDPPIKHNPKISRSTNDAVLWAMEMRPADRPQTIPEFLKALRGQPVPARKPVQAAKMGAAPPVLAFKSGAASSLTELVELCDRYLDEAEDYLFNGYIEKWLAQTGAAALAQTARTMTSSYGSAKRKGLELFVREVCQVARIDPSPALAAQPPQLDLGKLPIGARSSAQIRLKNQGRGYAWGKIDLQPPIPGVIAPPKFDGSHSQIDLAIDLAAANPGAYQSTLVVQADGVSSTVQVPVHLEVVPLSAQVQPASVNLGSLAYGTKTQAQVRLTNKIAGGRFVGQASLSPAVSGVECTPKLDGPSPDIIVNVDTTTLEAGKAYVTTLLLSTNAGTFKVPVQFSTTIAWKTVWSWAIGCAAGAGAVLAGLRAVVASTIQNQDAWVLDYRTDKDLMVLSALLSAVIVGGIALGVYSRRKRKK